MSACFCSFTYLLEYAFPVCRKCDFFKASLNSDAFPTESETHGGPSSGKVLHVYHHSFHASSGGSKSLIIGETKENGTSSALLGKKK